MTGPLGGEQRERRRDLPVIRRARSWLVWWVLLMLFWVMIDDSLNTDELLAGATAAAWPRYSPSWLPTRLPRASGCASGGSSRP
jgi:hypothetical protein